MHQHLDTSVIVLIVHNLCVFAGESERHAPVAADPDRPGSRALSGERMEFETRQAHVLHLLGRVKPAKDQPQPLRVFGLNTFCASSEEEGLKAFVFEAPDHRANCNQIRYGLQAEQRQGCAAARSAVRTSRWLCATSLQIASDVHCPMEDAEYEHIPFGFDEVGNSVTAVDKDTHVAGGIPIAISALWVLFKLVHARRDSISDPSGRRWILLGNVIMDLTQPTERFVGPDYFCQDRIRLFISSFEMVRPASASASPRSIIA